jgi:class 3 adenylate cyclase/tetratricopeptide (TPR) repeat protein
MPELDSDSTEVARPAGPHGAWVGALEAEKRLGTILFADMSDSVALTRDLHPEDALVLVNKLLRVIAEALFAYGGRVDRFLGDGALGVFGVTQTHESDPERAILAALQIREAARELGIAVTVGINTGDVYAGDVGSAEYQERTVMGPVVNLASRLQTQAAAGEILVGETTYRLARRAFRFTAREIEVKGLPQPLEAYSVAGVLPRPTSRPLGSQPAELVGRSAELEALLLAAEMARSGQGQIVTLVGEPGVGKSRLVAELRSALQIDGGNGEFAWLDGRCLEFSEAMGYWPFVDALHHWLDWHTEERDSVRHARIVKRLAELGRAELISEEQQQILLDVLASLLSVRIAGSASSAQRRVSRLPRHLTFHSLRRLFVALAQRRPLVLALEDVHWADSLSMDFLSFLLERISSTPILVLCTHRPDQEHACRELDRLAARKCPGSYVELRPSELTSAESSQLAASLLGAQSLSEPIRELIRLKCHGNPLFIEEVVRSMVASGALYATPAGWRVVDSLDAVQLSESIQSVILSRVDRLPAELKQLLQYASVLGLLFRPKLLEHLGMDPDRLRRELFLLSEAGLVVQQREAPDEEYAFKHALTRETIYDTILRRTRKRLHATAAEALEHVYRSHLEEHYAELARHYSLAEHYEQAAAYFIQAGERGKRLFANREARSHFEFALRDLAHLDKSENKRLLEVAALEGLGDVCFRLGAHHAAEEQFQRALDYPDAERSPERFATLSWKLSDAIHWQGDNSRAIAVAEQGLAVAGGASDTSLSVRLLEVIMRSHWAANDLDSARARGDELQRLLPEVSYFDSLYMVYYALAWLEIKWKEFDRAREWLERMRQTCEEHDNEIGLARCYHGLGDLTRANRDFGEAAEWFDRSVVLCERVGDAHLLLEGYMEWAHALLLHGRPEEEAEPYIQKGLVLAEEMAATGSVSSIQALCSALGRAFVERGNIRRGIIYHEMAFDFGPHPSAIRSLMALRPLYECEGRSAEFLEFCERVNTFLPEILPS